MSTQAYKDWVRRGRHYTLCRWLIEIKGLAHNYDVAFLGDLGNEPHLQNNYPQDHCPFSYTAYPVPLPGYYVCAIDLGNGPHSGRILAAARAGKLPWLKYMNFGGVNYSRRRNNFWDAASTADKHLHLSGMSNHINTGLGGFNPFIEPVTPTPVPDTEDDMRGMLAKLDNDDTIWYGTGVNGESRPLVDMDAYRALVKAGAVELAPFKNAGVMFNAIGSPEQA